MTPEVREIAKQMREILTRIDAAVHELNRQAKAEAAAENQYRKKVAEVWIRMDRDGMLAAEADAIVKSKTADARYRRDLARGLWTSAREALRARQNELSALQSLLRIEESEAALAKYGPDRGT